MSFNPGDMLMALDTGGHSTGLRDCTPELGPLAQLRLADLDPAFCCPVCATRSRVAALALRAAPFPAEQADADRGNLVGVVLGEKGANRWNSFRAGFTTCAALVTHTVLESWAGDIYTEVITPSLSPERHRSYTQREPEPETTLVVMAAVPAAVAGWVVAYTTAAASEAAGPVASTHAAPDVAGLDVAAVFVADGLEWATALDAAVAATR